MHLRLAKNLWLINKNTKNSPTLSLLHGGSQSCMIHYTEISL
jgi:hypothetical protein